MALLICDFSAQTKQQGHLVRTAGCIFLLGKNNHCSRTTSLCIRLCRMVGWFTNSLAISQDVFTCLSRYILLYLKKVLETGENFALTWCKIAIQSLHMALNLRIMLETWEKLVSWCILFPALWRSSAWCLATSHQVPGCWWDGWNTLNRRVCLKTLFPSVKSLLS